MCGVPSEPLPRPVCNFNSLRERDPLAVNEFRKALAQHSFVVLKMPDANVRAPLSELERTLGQLNPDHDSEGATISGLDSYCQQCTKIDVQSFDEKVQLRWTSKQPNQQCCSGRCATCTPLIGSLGTSRTTLRHVAVECLQICTDTADDLFDSSSMVLDAFFYPGFEQDGDDAKAKLSPCPAHEDKSLVTVIADNCDALEVYDRAHDCWSRLTLEADEVVIIANRELARLSQGTQRYPACRHRVAAIDSSRMSLVFEMRLNAHGVQVVARQEADLLGCCSLRSPTIDPPHLASQHRPIGALFSIRTNEAPQSPKCIIS